MFFKGVWHVSVGWLVGRVLGRLAEMLSVTQLSRVGPEQSVVTAKMAATHRNNRGWSDLGRGEVGGSKRRRQFPIFGRHSIIKESAGWVTPNQTLTTLPTHSFHLLCTLQRHCEYFNPKQVQVYSLKGQKEKEKKRF